MWKCVHVYMRIICIGLHLLHVWAQRKATIQPGEQTCAMWGDNEWSQMSLASTGRTVLQRQLSPMDKLCCCNLVLVCCCKCMVFICLLAPAGESHTVQGHPKTKIRTNTAIVKFYFSCMNCKCVGKSDMRSIEQTRVYSIKLFGITLQTLLQGRIDTCTDRQTDRDVCVYVYKCTCI